MEDLSSRAFKKSIIIPVSHIGTVFGKFDENIKKIETAFSVSVINRGDEVIVSGAPEKVNKAADVLESLSNLAGKGEAIDHQKINYLIDSYGVENLSDIEKMSEDVVCVTYSGKPIKAKTLGQKKYIDQIRKNTIVFSVGPAGTGKTYLAMAMAIAAFKRNEIARIILTRPAIEAGEKLGFLPGDLQQKVDPYLRPLNDALYEIMGADSYLKNLERGAIEIAPLAYMRGRTLDNAFIVLDEAQNTTPEQMKMFLTRLGFGSKAVVTGDLTQIDLPEGKRSGLNEAVEILSGIEEIGISKLSNKDVVRHPLIQKIIAAYDKKANNNYRRTASFKGKKRVVKKRG